MTYDRPPGGRHCSAPTRARQFVLYVIVLLQPFGIVICFPAWGQVAPFQLPPPFPSEKPPLPEKPLPPRPPEVLPTPPAPPLKPERFPFIKVFVREIRVIGSTALTPEEIAKVTAPYVNRELTSEDFEALRLALTFAYVNKGYVTSGAIIPDQTVIDGVITIEIIEGVLTDIEVEGNKWFRSSYIRDRVALGAKPPVNITSLQERLQLLQQDDRIQRLNAELKPGVKPGESLLQVRVSEASPYKAWLEFNNYQSPTIGAEEGFVTVAHQNLTGNGDPLSFRYGQSEGVNPYIDTRYALPLNAYDTTLILHYEKNNFRVISGGPPNDPDFSSLGGINSKSDIYEITIRQPVYRSLNQEFALALTGSHLVNRISSPVLESDPGAIEIISPGSRDGQSVISALRFSQEWVYRTSNEVIAANSRFSVGLDIAGATINNDVDAAGNHIPDGQFFVWLGQFQYARRLDPWGIRVISLVTCQLANDRLYPLEQVAVGGRYSVRGYRENTFVRDDALISSLELRYPVLRSAVGADIVQVATFVDFGRSWVRKTNAASNESAHGDTLTSAGLGVIMNIAEGSRFEAYWGKRLNSVPSPQQNRDIQDYGFGLQLVVQVY